MQALRQLTLALFLRLGLSQLDVTILHINDHHSHLEHDDFELDVRGVEGAASETVDINYGGYPMLASLAKSLESSSTHPILIHSGDAITGTTYWSLFRGEADAAMMNSICFDAFTLGNHEFDDGDAVLASFIDLLQGDGACASPTPVLSANLHPGASSPLLDKVLNYTIKDFGGEKVAIVGITVASKTMLSSQPSPGTTLGSEMEAAQFVIDDLTGQGVNKIILSTHIQFAADLALAQQLTGVDVIIGGDSHTLLGEEDGVGKIKSPAAAYPTMTTDGAGNTVCVAQAWEYGHLLGQLSVQFDAAGMVTSCSGSPKVPFEAPSDPASTAIVNYLEATGEFQEVTPDSNVMARLVSFTAQVDSLKQEVVGTTAQVLCLERIPGQGRSTDCEVSATWEHGSQIGQVVARAFLHVTATAHICIQNAGGVRVDQAAGNITLDDVFTILPFSNTLVTFEMTGAQIKQVLEEALSFIFDVQASTGAYPIAAGLRFHIDATQASGSRVTNLQVNPRLSGSWADISDTSTYTVVTNNFIAGGGDGYATFGALTFTDLYTEYAEGLRQYVVDVLSVPFPTTDEYSTQAFVDANGCDHFTHTYGTCPLEITILHMNDHHSHLATDDFDLDVSGVSGVQNAPQSGEVEIHHGGYPLLASLFKSLTASSKNPIKIHSGDAISGTSYYTLFKGAADAAMMSHVCFDAFTLGNHEFDDGDANLASFLDMLHTPDVCEDTHVLSANLRPGSSSPLLDKVENYMIKEFGSESVAVVGITIKSKTMESSNPSPGTTLEDEATTAQAVIDDLKSKGYDKIILSTHIGHGKDLELASQLTDVDVILGGDSHTLMGSSAGVGLIKTPHHSQYPIETTDAAGDKVCVAQAWEYSHLVGKLTVVFDSDGKVTSCTGMPQVPFEAPADDASATSRSLDSSDSAAVVTHLESTGEFVHVMRDAALQTTLDNFSAQVAVLKQQVIGQNAEMLCNERIPGQGRSELCDVAATWEHGSMIGQVVARAFLDVTATADIAIQNAGGVRVDLEAGDISVNDVYTILPFSNTLVTLDMTGAQVVQVIEDALSHIYDNEDFPSGGYPIAAGLRFHVDASQAQGGRLSNVQVNPRLSGSWSDISPTTTYKVVTNHYIAGGKDGYATFGTLTFEDTFTEYAQGLVTYIQKVSTVTPPSNDEYSTQVFVDHDGCDHSTTGYGQCHDRHAGTTDEDSSSSGSSEDTISLGVAQSAISAWTLCFALIAVF